MSSRTGFNTNGAAMTRFDQHRAKIETNKLKAKSIGKYIKRKQFVLSTFEVKCQLYRGGEKFVGRTIDMTPSAMGRENRKFRLAFIKMMDNEEKTGREPVLYNWRIIDREALERAIEKNVDDIKLGK